VTPDALQDLFSMQPAMVVGLISMMTGSALQEDNRSHCRGLGTQRAGHPGYETGIRNDSPYP
jgi:hypothetical protein